MAFREASLASPHALLLRRLDVLADAQPGVEVDHALIEIIGKARLYEQRLRGRRMANNFEMPEGVSTQSIAALFLRSGLIPSAEANIATASKKTEGAPDSAISAARSFPDFRRTPPIFGATIASSAPSASSASRKAFRAIAVGTIRYQRSNLSTLQHRLGLTDEGKRGRRIKVDRRLVRRDFGSLSFHADRGFDRLRQRLVNQSEMTEHAASDDRRFDLGKLEGEGVLNVPLFGRGHGAVKLTRLAVMIGEALGPQAQLLPCFALALLGRESAEPALRVLARASRIEAIGLVSDPAWVPRPIRRMPSRCKFLHRTARTVDRQP